MCESEWLAAHFKGTEPIWRTVARRVLGSLLPFRRQDRASADQPR